MTKHTPGALTRVGKIGFPYAAEIADGDNRPFALIYGATKAEQDARVAQTIAAPDTAAERDRLRAALEGAAATIELCEDTGDTQSEALKVTLADIHDALANTSPAPVENVNAELLEAAQRALEVMPGAELAGVPCSDARDMLRAAIAKAEKAGG